MRLSKFNIIVLIDGQGGMSKDGVPPFAFNSWKKFLKEQTIGNKNNAVIMGRKTYENVLEGNFLPQRENFVISSKYEQQDHTNIVVYKSLVQCLAGIANRTKKYNDVWILGGERLFRECVKKFLPYCNKIVLGKIQDDGYECDQFFPINDLLKKGIESKVEQQTKDYKIITYHPRIPHQETQFLSLLEKILTDGRKIFDQKKSEYLKLSNQHLEFDISEEFPIITSRFFDAPSLLKTFIDDLDNMDFSNDSIGYRLRCDKPFSGMKNYEGNTDQLETLVDKLETSRTVTVHLVRDTDDECFIPTFIKFSVSVSRKYLNTTVCCERMEMFKYFPYYLIYIALLSSITAHLLSLYPKKVFFFFAEALIDSNYYSYARKQIQNDPKPLCSLSLRNVASVKCLSDYKKENIDFLNYDAWQKMNFDKQFKDN